MKDCLKIWMSGKQGRCIISEGDIASGSRAETAAQYQFLKADPLKGDRRVLVLWLAVDESLMGNCSLGSPSSWETQLPLPVKGLGETLPMWEWGRRFQRVGTCATKTSSIGNPFCGVWVGERVGCNRNGG